MWSVLIALAARLHALLGRDRLDDDALIESDTHIALLAARNMRAGMTPEAAHQAARRQFGNPTVVREDLYRMNTIRWLDALAQDVRDAARGLRRSPTFTAVAVATLALGIGVNAAVFAVTNGVLFKGFRGIDGNDRILYIGTQKNGRGCCASYPDFLDWRAQATSFAGMGVVADLQIALSDGNEAGAEHYIATQITTDAFHVLRQAPAFGRDFLPSDGQPGAPRVAILRHSFWERRYGKDPAVLGRTLRINGTPTTVIGVMPRDFSFPQNEDLWLPLVSTADLHKREARGLWFAFGRLADGATLEGARLEMDTIGHRLASAYPQTNDGWMPRPLTFAEFFVGRDAAWIYGALWGAVGCVLLIACANLANLMLVRAMGRARELAVRVALGAPRWRIVQPLLVESLILSVLSGAAGWWIATVSVRAYELTANPPARAWSNHLLDFGMDGRVFLYLLTISAVAAFLFGLAPAAYLSTLDITGTLKDGGRTTAGGTRGLHLSGLLVVGEMALAVVLLASAGVMIRSFVSMSTANLGVRSGNVTAMLLNLPEDRYRTAATQITFFERLKGRLEATPGVEALAIASELPSASVRGLPYEVAGAAPVDDQHRPTVSLLTIGPAYFDTVGAAVLAGRGFNEFDGPSGALVAIVNQAFARASWPGDDPLGKRLRTFDGTAAGSWVTVVGVASHIAQNSADRQADDPIVYRPFRQAPGRAMWVIVRTGGGLSNISDVFQREVHAIDTALPIWIGPLALTDLMAAMGNYWRLGDNTALFAVFAAVALVLASIGLYAIVAHAVQRRTQEIGIRIAIGATASDIVTLVFRQGLRPSAMGLFVGLAASLAVTPVLRTQLVRVSPVDPRTLVATAAILMLAATLGCLLPAWYAMRVDPAVTLRHD